MPIMANRHVAEDLVARWAEMDAKSRRRMIQITGAAARLFAKNGFLESTMDEIAAAAGSSKGGLYYYFRTKNEVLFHIVNRTMDELLTGLPEAMEHEAPGRKRVHLLVKRQIDYFRDNIAAVRTMLNDRKALPSAFTRFLDAKEEAYYSIVERAIAETVGPVAPPRIKAMTFAFFGICNWIPSWYRPKGPLSPEELVDVTYGLFMDGIASQARA